MWPRDRHDTCPATTHVFRAKRATRAIAKAILAGKGHAPAVHQGKGIILSCRQEEFFFLNPRQKLYPFSYIIYIRKKVRLISENITSSKTCRSSPQPRRTGDTRLSLKPCKQPAPRSQFPPSFPKSLPRHPPTTTSDDHNLPHVPPIGADSQTRPQGGA
jgi:hypothetical protein